MNNRTAATVNTIKSFILSHNLRSGDPLPGETTFSEQLGVSRSSVREALRRLESLDIVSVQKGRGSFVGNMSLEPLIETLVLRTALQNSSGSTSLSEVVTLRKALDIGTSREIVAAMEGSHNSKLWEIVDTMTLKATRGETYMQEDIDFHSEIFSYLGNELLQQLMSAMWVINQTILPHIDDAPNRELGATYIEGANLIAQPAYMHTEYQIFCSWAPREHSTSVPCLPMALTMLKV